MTESGFTWAMACGVPVVVTPEEIDITNADGFEAALLQCSGQGPGKLVVDMSRTRFCDTAGLRALVGAHKRAQSRGGEVRVVVSGPVLKRIFQLTGLDQVIPSFTSLGEALS